MRPVLPLLFAAALAGSPAASAADYAAVRGSTLGFVATYQDEEVTGSFADFSARIDFNPVAPAACAFDVRIALASVVADMDDATETLKSPDFFAVDTAADARYVAHRCRALADGRFVADGELTLRGVTKPAPLTFTWSPGAALVLAGDATVQRLQFGVGGGEWADTGLLVDAVKVETRLVLEPKP
jgi:polyisoprenoid-binding protein YceI